MITRGNVGDKKENKISPKENKILKLKANGKYCNINYLLC